VSKVPDSKQVPVVAPLTAKLLQYSGGTSTSELQNPLPQPAPGLVVESPRRMNARGVSVVADSGAAFAQNAAINVVNTKVAPSTMAAS